MLAASTLQVALVEPRRRNDERHRHFSPHRILHAYDRRLSDLRLLEKKILHLARIDVESAGDDQLAPAAQQRVVTVVGYRGDVAGLEPLAVERRGRGRIAAPVAGEDI